ncbi:MAG TPA: hypothetical protein VK604_03850 [Bryobacteraceae bacterium]|nr:hypothetical protein [Bryobacteraceae bacterium]
MTKVQLSFKLSRPLRDDDLKQISRVHAVFGMLAVKVSAGGDELFVEYDASRLTVSDVKGTLEAHGLPLQ